MKTKDIKDMASAYMQVLGLTEKKKLDPVGKEDGDIDNDGDKDKSDEYLMKRRKAISKAITKEEAEQIDEISSDLKSRYAKKAQSSLKRATTYKAKAQDDAKKASANIDRANSGDRSVNVNKQYDRIDRADSKVAKHDNTIAKRTAGLKRANEEFDLSDFSIEELEEFMESTEYDQLDEISKKTLGSYVKKASGSAAGVAAGIAGQAAIKGKAHPDDKRQLRNRLTGISRATDKLTKEEVELDEAKWMVTHKKEQGTTGKYIDSTQFHPDERSARMHKGQLKHTPGVLKGSIKMKKVHYQDMAKEDTQWSVYNRILEKRDMHIKGATAPETMDDKFKGKGAKDAKNDIENGANWDDTAKKGMDDVAAAGRAGPSKKSRPGDNTAGDNNIINKPEDVTKKGGAQ